MGNAVRPNGMEHGECVPIFLYLWKVGNHIKPEFPAAVHNTQGRKGNCHGIAAFSAYGILYDFLNLRFILEYICNFRRASELGR